LQLAITLRMDLTSKDVHRKFHDGPKETDLGEIQESLPRISGQLEKELVQKVEDQNIKKEEGYYDDLFDRKAEIFLISQQDITISFQKNELAYQNGEITQEQFHTQRLHIAKQRQIMSHNELDMFADKPFILENIDEIKLVNKAQQQESCSCTSGPFSWERTVAKASISVCRELQSGQK
jgi:hypothetical protein